MTGLGTAAVLRTAAAAAAAATAGGGSSAAELPPSAQARATSLLLLLAAAPAAADADAAGYVTQGLSGVAAAAGATSLAGNATAAATSRRAVLGALVGRCGLTLSNPISKRAWFQRLKPKSGEPLLNFGFKFNLRRYTLEVLLTTQRAILAPGESAPPLMSPMINTTARLDRGSAVSSAEGTSAPGAAASFGPVPAAAVQAAAVLASAASSTSSPEVGRCWLYR